MSDVPANVEELLKQNAFGLSRSQIAAKCRAYNITGWLGQLKKLNDAGRIKVCGMFWSRRFKLVSVSAK